MRQAIQSVRKSSTSSSQSNPPSHVSSSYTCSYAGLTGYFSRLVKCGLITRSLLKRLLYRQFAESNFNFSDVKVRRSHKVECVIFPTQLSFEIFKASRTWFKSQTIELDGTSTSTDRTERIRTYKRQNAIDMVDSSDSMNSSDTNSFEFIKNSHSQSNLRDCVINFESECESEKLKNVLGKPNLQPGNSSFDLPNVPATHRAYEDLSVLGVCETGRKNKKRRSKSMPSLTNMRNENTFFASSNFERSASLGIITVMKSFERDDSIECRKKTNSEIIRTDFMDQKSSNDLSSICFSTSYICALNASAEDNRRQSLPVENSNLNDGCFRFSQVGLSSRYCSDFLFASPRSSDSGLADIAGTGTLIFPNHSENCEKWRYKVDSLCHSSNVFYPTTESNNLDYVSDGVVTTTPTISCKNIFIENPSRHTSSSNIFYDPSAVPRQNEDIVNNGGVYRSGMYAHWWLKTRIPAEAFGDKTKSSIKSSKGKKSVRTN